MAQQSLSGARVVDPVLTEIARGFKQPAGQFVAPLLFPTVEVGARAGRIIRFGKEDFMQYVTARAPGAKTGRVQFGYASDPYSLIDHSLEGMVPREVLEEGRAGEPGLDHAEIAIRRVQRAMELDREIEAATIARNATTYGAQTVTLSGTNQWSDPASKPFTDVETAKEAVRASVGFRPNVMVIGPKVLSGLKMNPAVMARLIPTGRDLPSMAILEALFEVDMIISGDMIQATDAGVMSDVWGKDVILAYVDKTSVQDMGSPSFGYTYQLRGYPFAEEPYMGRNEKTWYYPYTDCRAPVLTGPTAGYLIKNAVA